MSASKNLSVKLFAALILFFVAISIAHSSYAAEDYVTDELIVKLKSTADESGAVANIRSRGAVITKSLSELKMMLIQISPGDSLDDAQKALESNPNVEYVEKNYIVYEDVNPNDPGFNQQTYLNVIDAPQAWDTQKGSSNVIIAVLDTGVESSHEDISGKTLPGCNVLGSNTDTSCGSDTSDIDGHGTGVAGTAAAKTNNGVGVAGVCWNCQILPVKVLGNTGSGTVSDTVDGIMYARQYAINNPSKRIIINMSLGRDCQVSGVTQAEQDAINAAWSAGLLIVASAGNSGNSDLQCPAAADHVIAVSATNNNDTLASFSSYGSFVDLAAPGVNILNAIGQSSGSSYAFWSGTSFSSPIVSGVSGLVWSVNTSLTNAQVDQILRDSAENIGPSLYFGDGRVNADFAVSLASGSPSPTPAPVPTPTPMPPPSGSSTLTGFNPGTAGVRNTLTVTGAGRGATVRFYYSKTTGTSSITSGVCKGKTLSLRSPILIGSARADSTGKATLTATLSSTLGGSTLYLQSRSETATACAISNRVTQTIKKSGSSTRSPSRTRSR